MMYSLQYHTGIKNKKFDTSSGRSITQGLKKLAKAFDLSFLFGTAPQDYTLRRYWDFSPIGNGIELNDF